jgi:hypothetical protein
MQPDIKLKPMPSVPSLSTAMKFWIGPEMKYPYLIAMDRTFFKNNFNDISD